jgi:hypothetical protein
LGCQFRKVSYPTYLKTEVTETTEASLSNHQSGVRKGNIQVPVNALAVDAVA